MAVQDGILKMVKLVGVEDSWQKIKRKITKKL